MSIIFLLHQKLRVNAQSKILTQMKDAMEHCADDYEHPPHTPKFVVQSRIVQ